MITHKKLTLFLISFLALFLLCSGSVFSQTMQKERPFKPGINLSAEQKEKIRSLTLEGRKDEIRLKSDLRIAQLELRELMQNDKLDKSSINRKVEEIGDLRTKLQKVKVERKMELREILTKEQLQSLRERRMHRMMDKRLMERKMKGKEGRTHRKGMHRMRPISGETSLPLLPDKFGELPLLSEELPLEPELVLLEEELFPLFEELEPIAPLEELPPLLEELPPVE